MSSGVNMSSDVNSYRLAHRLNADTQHRRLPSLTKTLASSRTFRSLIGDNTVISPLPLLIFQSPS